MVDKKIGFHPITKKTVWFATRSFALKKLYKIKRPALGRLVVYNLLILQTSVNEGGK